MKFPCHPCAALRAFCLLFLLALPSAVHAAPPDLTTVDLSTIDRSATYNLGPTGMRGWIYISSGNVGAEDIITDESRQILVTVVGTGTPADGVLAVNDVILGASGGTGTVPVFTSDARKAFGWSIGDAETAANNGVMKIKRWRAGVTTDVQITMPVMGSYTSTAPYNCPKSALILANARNSLVSQLLASQTFLTNDYGGAIKGLALLASVQPADPNYATVQTRLQAFAHSLAPPNLQVSMTSTWQCGYINLFLAEYYLSTGDSYVVHGLNAYTVAVAQAQSRYGTYGHLGALLNADGSLHGTIRPYGPVNSAGLAANISIVMGKKALLAAGQPIDPEIDPAITRASNFFGWYVNKGPIPYGEHEPYVNGHAPNGKDAMCAVLFGLQDNRPVETEYFTRMVTAGFNGREYGHTGQGFSYLWGAMGANMGGQAAVAAYLQPVRWHLDLERRSDGSFVYDGAEQYGAGSTADGTYLGASAYYDINPTASYLLTYALPLQRLYLTGKNANPAYVLDSTRIADAVAAATFWETCSGLTITQLEAALAQYDPVVRSYAATELSNRTLATTDINTLITMAEGTNVNQRQGACEVLGLIKESSALPALARRLDTSLESDVWVRGKAALALNNMGASASPDLTPMLTAMTANATDPDAIDWNDPVQISNGYLAEALFNGNLSSTTIGASKSLLYPAVKAGLKQPDSHARSYLDSFIQNLLTLPDVEALMPDLMQVVATESQADTMWSMNPRAAGISTLMKYQITEGIELGLAMQQVPDGFDWSCSDFLIPGLNALASYGDSARWTLPTLRTYLSTWDPTSTQYPVLVSTINSIENATSSPTLVPGLPVANPQVVSTVAAKAVTLTGYDSAGLTLSYAIVNPPAHGTLTGTPPNVTYTPAANYYGTDSFTFKTNDGTSDSKPGTVSIIVGIAGAGLRGDYYNNVNFTSLALTRTDPQVNFDWLYGSPDPSMGPDTFSVRWTGQLLAPETTTYKFSTLDTSGVRLWVNGVLVLDHSIDHLLHWGDGTAINLTAGRKYSVTMEYYQSTGRAAAKLKWSGPSFAGDNGVIITKDWLYDGSAVTNQAPAAQAQSVTTAEDVPAAITLVGGDPNFDALTYAVASQPAHGTLSGTAPNLTYTPAANYNGTDSFTFTVNDGSVTSSAATVSITVTPVNDATLATVAATYAGYTATSATLNATLTCDTASYAVYAYWGTTSGGATVSQWQNQALVGTFSNVTSAAISYPVSGLTANTRYYFTFRAVTSAGELWANNVLSFGPSPSCDMLTFGLPNEPGVISGTAIAWPVLSSAVISNLAPVFTLSPGATCNKASGSSQNFTSPQTYTVTAQDGSSKSYVVTVSQMPNATYSWNSTSSGNWSSASRWLNESGAAAAPASAGQPYYTINFTNTGTYTATSDLSAGFLLNRMNFSGPTATIAGNSLAFTAWASPYGTLPPQINQNGSSAITISAPLSLPSNLTFGGTGTGMITLTGLVGSGSLLDGCLTQAGSNTLYLNNANNGYPGGLIVNNSTLKASVGTNKAFGAQTNNWQGTVPQMINSTLQTTGGGWCTLAFNLQGTNTMTATDTSTPFFSKGLIGTGSLTLTGNSISFGGDTTATYSGDVRIALNSSATVKFDGVQALGSGGTVYIAGSGGGSISMGCASSNGATLDNYMELDTNLIVLSYYGTTRLIFNRDITGTGNITRAYDTTDKGTKLQFASANNTYSGGTIFKTGVLEIVGNSSLGTGTVTMGGKASTSTTHNVILVNLAPITLSNNIVLAGINETTLTDPLAVTTFQVDGYDLNLTGNISGTGGLLKTGANTLTLSGTNTCTGPVQVQAGVLDCTNASSLGQGTLNITDGATVMLDYDGTRQIAALTLNGGTALPNGTYGSSASPAPNKDDVHFSGTGMVTVGAVAEGSTVTAVALTGGSNPSTLEAPLTFTATVTGTAPTGTVIFYCGATALGTAPLNGSFQASFTTTLLSPGWQTVSACYQGDANNLPSVSGLLDQLVGGSTATSSAITYDFSTNTLQGWNNRVWNPALNGGLGAWFDLAPDATTTTLTLQPPSSNDGLFKASNSGYVTYAGNGNHLNTQWLRSPQFFLNGSGDLTAQLTGGMSYAALANDLSVPYAAVSGGGFRGLVLRRVSDGAFVLAKSRASNGSSAVTVTFTQAELAPFVGSGTYTLDLINQGYGSYGWVYLDNVSIPGSLMAASSNKDITGMTFPGLGGAGIAGTAITLVVPRGTPMTALAPTFTLSIGASASPPSGTTRDFSGAQSYVITAQDGSTKTYTVTVSTLNHPPVANAQAVSTPQNTAVAITLTASDADGDTLSYAIVTQPAHGTLTGTGANITYTPTSGYSGADSFTFKANDGIADSAAATVSLTVVNMTYTWNSAVAGNWSDGSKWSGSVAPNSSGLAGYVLGFNVTGTYMATSDFSAGFLLNQLVFGGSTVTVAGNSLAFTASGSNQPSINQNSSVAVVVSAPASLTANLTCGGTGSGQVSLTGALSGTGSLSKSGTNTLVLQGVNTFSGGMTINSGTVSTGNTPSNNAYLTALGADGSTVTINTGGTLIVSRNVFANHPLVLNGGTLSGTSGNGNDGWGGTISLTADSALYSTSSGPFAISGNISGSYGITKTGTTLATLSGTNTYGGNTSVSAGSLQMMKPAALYNGIDTNWMPAKITVASGAILIVSIGGTNDFNATQAGTLFTNLTASVNNNGLTAGSIIGFDTTNSGASYDYTAVLRDSSGTGGGSVGLKKMGPNTLRLTNTGNSFSGKVIISPYTATHNSVLSVASLNSVATNAALGTIHSATSCLGAPTTVANGTIDLGISNIQGGGTLVYTGSGDETTDRVINFAGSNASNFQGLDQSGGGLLKFTSAFTRTGNAAQSVVLRGETGRGEIVSGMPVFGTLTKSGANTWMLDGANAHTGVTTVSGGALVLNHALALPGGIGTTGGTSALTFNGGVIGLGAGDFTRSLGTAGTVTAANFTGNGGWAAYNADRAVNLGGAFIQIVWATANTGFNGKSLILGAATADHTVDLQNPIDLGTAMRTVQVDHGTATIDAKLSGNLTGAGGGLTKTGAGTLNLTGTNTYTGATSVQAGTLACASANSLTGGSIDITSGAKLQLNFTGTRQISALTFNGGSALPTGTYGSSASPAANKNDTWFSGTGTVTVGAPYTAWTLDSAQGLSTGVNDGPLQDPDHDGICNLMEFALGGAPMVSSQAILPTVTQAAGNLVFQYNRNVLSRPPATTQVVQYGSDLTGWTDVPIPATSSGIVTITPGVQTDRVQVAVPNPGSKVFFRLKVSQ